MTMMFRTAEAARVMFEVCVEVSMRPVDLKGALPSLHPEQSGI